MKGLINYEWDGPVGPPLITNDGLCDLVEVVDVPLSKNPQLLMHYVGGNKVSVVRSLTQFTIVFYEFQFKVGVTLFFFANWSNGQEAEILYNMALDMKHNW